MNGDAARHWFLVVQGHVEVVRFGCDGDERVFHRFGPGQCVAEAAMFMAHGRYPMQARSVGTTAAWRLGRCARSAPAKPIRPGLVPAAGPEPQALPLHQ